MPSRDELKAQIDNLPDNCLEMVNTLLQHYINPPPPPPPEMERMRKRGQEFRRIVEERYRETQTPETGACMGTGFGGSGFRGIHKGTPHGVTSFSYWDGKALVQQALHSYDGQDVEIMERFAFDARRTKLLFTIEAASGGRTVRHDEEFPGLESA